MNWQHRYIDELFSMPSGKETVLEKCIRTKRCVKKTRQTLIHILYTIQHHPYRTMRDSEFTVANTTDNELQSLIDNLVKQRLDDFIIARLKEDDYDETSTT